LEHAGRRAHRDKAGAQTLVDFSAQPVTTQTIGEAAIFQCLGIKDKPYDWTEKAFAVGI
jgi:D-serine deaminase-like pyridoxal phosphate-dependent protein